MSRLTVHLFFFLSLTVCLIVAQQSAGYNSYEVWLLEQADSHPSGGGYIYIYDETSYTTGTHIAVLDIANMSSAAGCTIGKRPHMSASYPRPTPQNPTPNTTHITLSMFQSGQVYIIDVRQRTIVGCVTTLGGHNAVGGSIALHVAYLYETGATSAILLGLDLGAAGQNGYVHKISANFATNQYALVETLPLAPYQATVGALVRPLCAHRDNIRGYYYLSSQSGGILVLDPGSETVNMSIKYIYDATSMPRSSCLELTTMANTVLMSSEDTNAENGTDNILDRLILWPNGRLAEDVFELPQTIDLPGTDAHYGTMCRTQFNKEYVFVWMRLSSQVHIIDLDVRRIAKTINLATPEAPNPTPDISQLEVGYYEGSWRVWVVLRGPEPLSAIAPIRRYDRTPGVMSLIVRNDCLDITWANDSLFLTPANKTIQLSDPHGLHKLYYYDPIVTTTTTSTSAGASTTTGSSGATTTTGSGGTTTDIGNASGGSHTLRPAYASHVIAEIVKEALLAQ